MTKLFFRALLLLIPVYCMACQPAAAPPTTKPAGELASNQKQFDYPDGGISFFYPADWKPVPGTKSQLKVAAPTGGQLTLDVPTLPAHIPGLIPIDAVTSGYVNDAKKKIPDGTLTNLPDPTVPNARQHWVKIAGHVDGKPAINEAVLLVHNDKVYILSIDTDDKEYTTLHDALAEAVKSLKWSE